MRDQGKVPDLQQKFKNLYIEKVHFMVFPYQILQDANYSTIPACHSIFMLQGYCVKSGEALHF